LLPGAVHVSLERGEEPEDIVQVLVDAASFARAKALRDLLVVSRIDDPAATAAVSRALDEIHALGAPQPFRIAFVACTLPQYSVYHFVERYADRLGIDAKVLVSLRDAQDWLGQRENPARVAPAQMCA
jgi:hypothetical protein